MNIDDRLGEFRIVFVFEVRAFANKLGRSFGRLRQAQVVQGKVILGSRQSVRLTGGFDRNSRVDRRLIPATKRRQISPYGARN